MNAVTPFTPAVTPAMTPSEIREKARAFAIWRVGSALDWSCTAREIAAETGVPLRAVRRICGERGWPLRAAASADLPKPVDLAFAQGGFA